MTTKKPFPTLGDFMEVEFHRKPTEDEIRFGHGATHYKDFLVKDIRKKDGTLKKRIKCPIDGLIYTR